MPQVEMLTISFSMYHQAPKEVLCFELKHVCHGTLTWPYQAMCEYEDGYFFESKIFSLPFKYWNN